jgi:putative phosphoribosyl transferase
MALFDSRRDAAQKLASALSAFRHSNPLILAVPRGAVEMGRILADQLGGEVDVVLVRKLGAPGNPEFAVGAVDETGWMYVADHAATAGADTVYLAAEKDRQLELLRQRRALYTPSRPPIDPKGRVVIVVDDGLATGATMIAALHAARARDPAHLVCAVPVAAPESLRNVRPHADELVYLDAPYYFQAVGQFYREFPQVSDAEVVRLLEKPGQAPAGTV